MVVASISKEGKAIPWSDYSFLCFEFSASQSGKTIDVSTRGVTTILAILDFDTNGQIITTASSKSGSVITLVADLFCVVIGR